MKKKVVSLLAAMALAVTALAGCGSNNAATTGTDAATVAATTEAALLLRQQLLLKQLAKLSVV